MADVTIGTFNVENLFMRYRLLNNEKGAGKPKPVDPDVFVEKGGNILMLGTTLEDFGLISRTQRRSTGRVILENDPDVVAVQEVENMEALKQFNRKFLKKQYPHMMLVDANDPRLIDVAILSKHPIVHARTHQFDTGAGGKTIFSRDCLEVDIAVNNKTLTLFANHFKSKIGGGEERRRQQAIRVGEILQERFGKNLKGNFVVAGDLNDSPEAEELQPLLGLEGLENVVQTRVEDPDERWTHFFAPKREAQQLDYLLLSPSLSARTPKKNKAVIERRGLSDKVDIFEGKRFPGVGPEGTEASDHCGVFMTVRL